MVKIDIFRITVSLLVDALAEDLMLCVPVLSHRICPARVARIFDVASYRRLRLECS